MCKDGWLDVFQGVSVHDFRKTLQYHQLEGQHALFDSDSQKVTCLFEY